MFKRYAILITNQGMDAAIPLIDNPEDASKIKSKIINRYKIKIYFEEGKLYDYNDFDDNIKSEIRKQMNQDSKEAGGAPIDGYMAYELRKRYAQGGQLEIFIGLDEKWFKKFKHMNPYESAFYILDILINGKTRVGRFSKEKEETVIGMNLMKKFDKSNLKAKRREMMGHLVDLKDDPDEV